MVVAQGVGLRHRLHGVAPEASRPYLIPKKKTRMGLFRLLQLIAFALSCSSFHIGKPAQRNRNRSAVCVGALRPLSKTAVDKLVPFIATPEQLAWYRGRDTAEMFEQALESTMVAFVGAWGSYFASFFIGAPLAVVTGTAFCANGLIRPYLAAFQRSVAIRGVDGTAGSTGTAASSVEAALFSGVVASCVLLDDRGRPISGRKKGRRRSDSNVADAISPSHLDAGMDRGEHRGGARNGMKSFGGEEQERGCASWGGYEEEGRWLGVALADEYGRQLSLEAVPLSDKVRGLTPGQRCETVLFAPTKSDFAEVRGTTDVYVPAIDVWLGPYPYLDRAEFRGFLAFLERESGSRRQSGDAWRC